MIGSIRFIYIASWSGGKDVDHSDDIYLKTRSYEHYNLAVNYKLYI